MVNCHEDIFQARGTIWPARLNMADIRNGGNGGLWFWRGTAVHKLNATDWMACLDEYSEIKDLQVESDDYWAIVYEKLYWVRRRLYRWPLLSFPYVDHADRVVGVPASHRRTKLTRGELCRILGAISDFFVMDKRHHWNGLISPRNRIF